MTIGACSPPCSSSEMASTSVDSASPGRKLVDSLFSASVYLPGRFAAPDANSATRQMASTMNLAVRPAGTVRKRDTGKLLWGGEGTRGFYRAASARAVRVTELQERCELRRLGHRAQAGEALAHVRRRPPVDRIAPLQQRDAVRRAARDDDVGTEGAAHDALERLRAGADDRDLLDRGEVEVERLQQVPEGGRMLGRDGVQQPQHAERRLLVAMLAGQRAEPQQPERGGRRAGGDRRVLELLAPRDQRLVVVGDGEEAAALAIREALQDR